MHGASQTPEFEEVTYIQLSDLKHKVLLSNASAYDAPELKIIKFAGVYREGSSGSPDARYIRAACEAANAAWCTPANLLDFSELDYRWGDEMLNALGFGWDPLLSYHHPLAIIVGGRCRTALQSLLEEEYEDFCRENLDEAIALVRRKTREYETYVENWRPPTEPDLGSG